MRPFASFPWVVDVMKTAPTYMNVKFYSNRLFPKEDLFDSAGHIERNTTIKGGVGVLASDVDYGSDCTG
jgi:hypothetical protein